MKNKRYYQLMTHATRQADLYIFGEITSWEWMESDVSSYTLAKELQGLDVDVINVYINSYGGEVAEALAIYNQLRSHKATVRTVCDGFACSAASIIFMAGENRVMNPASLLMIHNALWCVSGNAAALRKAADDLDTINQPSITAYLSHVNIQEEELRQLMDQETWIPPEDAVRMGFATEIAVESAEGKVQQSARGAIFQRIMVPSQAPAAPLPVPTEKTVTTFLRALCKR